MLNRPVKRCLNRSAVVVIAVVICVSNQKAITVRSKAFSNLENPEDWSLKQLKIQTLTLRGKPLEIV